MSRHIACRPLRLLFAGLLLATAGCAADPTPYSERPVEQIYNEAMDQLGRGNFEAAAKEFDEVERQHPYSVWATKAQLMAAYALYEAEKFDDAVIAIDRFIQLHPTNQDAVYAYYLKALSYYAQISDVGRDQKITRLALGALEELVRRFPTSEYARDARLKIDLTRDHLAGKEMEIGRFYLRRDYLLAAINRFRAVVENYQTTSHVPEALHRLVEAYEALGMTDQAARVAAVLGHNYPGSEWYVDTYELVEGAPRTPGGDGFFSRTWAEAVSGTRKVGISPEEAKRLAAAKGPAEPVAPSGEQGETRTVMRAPEGTTGGGGEEGGWLSRQWGSVFGSGETAATTPAPAPQARPAAAPTAAPTAGVASTAAAATGGAAAADEADERPGWFSRQIAAVFGGEAEAGSDEKPAPSAAEPRPDAEALNAAEAESRRAAAEAERQAAIAAEVANAAAQRAALAEAAARRTAEERERVARQAAERAATLTAEARNAADERAKAQRAADYWSEQASSASAAPDVAEARANAEAAGKALIYWRETERYALAAAEAERRRAGMPDAAPASAVSGSPILPPAERAGTEVVAPGRTPPEPAVTAGPPPAPAQVDSGAARAEAAPVSPGGGADAWMRAREAALDRAPARTAGPSGDAAASRQATARMDDAYTTALAQAREEQKQAKAAVEYWAGAAASGGPVPARQAEENRLAAEQAFAYWQERERVIQAWRQGRGAGERSAESAPSEGPGMFERAWRSIF